MCLTGRKGDLDVIGTLIYDLFEMFVLFGFFDVEFDVSTL